MGGVVVNAEQERAELNALIKRLHEQIRIIDELFPEEEDKRKPQAQQLPYRYYTEERGTP